MKLDKWQEEVMRTPGNICLRSGRQVGKSTIISIKAAEYAVANPKKTILMIAAVERQAYLLFEKTLAYLADNYKNKVKRGRWRPTKSKVMLTNGSVIYCLPTGLTGYGIRGYTIDVLIADEAAFIPEEVWTAVTPMLAITKGKIILLSTPHGKEGYYYRCFSDPAFKAFHVSSEDCPRKSQEFLDREKARMSKVQYAQEYLGEFIDELRQFFSTALIKKVMSLNGFASSSQGDNFLGVDVARMGGDQTVLFSVSKNGDRLKQIDMDISTESRITETILRIKKADQKYNYKKIYIDDGGMGVGVFDPLLIDVQTRRKVEAINNASRSIDNEDPPRRKKILKEDLYNNLLHQMEINGLELFEDPEILLSLKSIQYEYTDKGRIKLFGKYDHIAEALVRAAWCMRNKSLNIYIA